MDTVADPIGLLTGLAAILPNGARYLPVILAYLGLAGGVCALLVAFVKPPASTAPAWWLTTYRVLNYVAANFGNARNAAPAGMVSEVRDAALTNSKLAAAAPELAKLVEPPAVSGVILPAKPAPSPADVIVTGNMAQAQVPSGIVSGPKGGV